jgi:hypothetical protein
MQTDSSETLICWKSGNVQVYALTVAQLIYTQGLSNSLYGTEWRERGYGLRRTWRP